MDDIEMRVTNYLLESPDSEERLGEVMVRARNERDESRTLGC